MTILIGARFMLKVSAALRWFAVLLITAMAATACAPSKQDVAEAKFGPAPDRCERLIQQDMDQNVFSGRSGEYSFKKPPYKAAVNRKFLAPREFGWIVEFEAKGPLAFGTGGYRTYHYFFSDDGQSALLTTDAMIHRIDEK